MSAIRAIIFDLDDTLYQEIDYVKSGFGHVSNFLSQLTTLDSCFILEKLILLFNEDKRRVFGRFLELQNLDMRLESEMLNEYRFHVPTLNLSQKNIELLKWLKDNGYQIGIITDGRPEGQRAKIKALNLTEYCNYIIITDELGGIEFRKPNEKAFLQMLSYFELAPEEAVYIGDNPAKDFVTCNKIGMTTIMLKNDSSVHSQENDNLSYRAKITLQNLCELKCILESW